MDPPVVFASRLEPWRGRFEKYTFGRFLDTFLSQGIRIVKTLPSSEASPMDPRDELDDLDKKK